MLCKTAMRHQAKCVNEKNFSNYENVTLLFWLLSGLLILLQSMSVHQNVPLGAPAHCRCNPPHYPCKLPTHKNEQQLNQELLISKME